MSKSFELVVNVRKVGAIGVFYPVPFIVKADTPKDAKQKWFGPAPWNPYQEWEFLNFISITEIPPESGKPISENNITYYNSPIGY